MYLFVYLFIYREKGRDGEREKNIDVRNTYRLPLTRPLLGTWPTTGACALSRNQRATFWFSGRHPTHWATLARAHKCKDLKF